jgi:hypothetical protein
VAKVAQARGAKFIKRGRSLIPLDSASEAIIGRAVHDVAEHLKFASADAYIAASPGMRRLARDNARRA